MARPESVQQPTTPSEGLRNVLLFVVMLVTFVMESEATKYVETTLRYQQPFTILYIAHSSMTIVLPLHLLYLSYSTTIPISSYVKGLIIAVKQHLVPADTCETSVQSGNWKNTDLPVRRFTTAVLWCTFGLTAPALLWFAAMPLSSVSDITAIWNSNAFWAYVFTVRLQRLDWEPRKLAAVVFAVLGVFVVVYGSGDSSSTAREEAKSPFVGNVLTLIASLLYALYQVLYDMYAVPPSENTHGTYSQANWQRISVTSIDNDLEDGYDNTPQDNGVVYPPPFGLYANLISSGIGLATFTLLWVFIPILDILGVETFHSPTNFKVVLGLAAISVSALGFLATFMIMLGAWGAIVTAVASLMTIVFVILTDILFKDGLQTLTIWDITGSGMIVCAFGTLAFESFRKRS